MKKKLIRMCKGVAINFRKRKRNRKRKKGTLRVTCVQIYAHPSSLDFVINLFEKGNTLD